MIVSISPPHYFPSADLIHRIALSGVHVIQDTIPFEENGMSYRCKIQSPVGWKYLNVPVLSKTGDVNTPLKEIGIYTSKPWEKNHLDAVIFSYKKAPFFKQYIPFIEEILTKKWDNILEINLAIYQFIIKDLELHTRLVLASDYKAEGKYMDQVVHLVDALIAEVYFAESYQKPYLETEKYREKLSEIQVKVVYQNYKPAVYKQLHSPFAPLLSVIDLFMNLGKKTLQTILKGNVKKIRGY